MPRFNPTSLTLIFYPEDFIPSDEGKLSMKPDALKFLHSIESVAQVAFDCQETNNALEMYLAFREAETKFSQCRNINLQIAYFSMLEAQASGAGARKFSSAAYDKSLPAFLESISSQEAASAEAAQDDGFRIGLKFCINSAYRGSNEEKTEYLAFTKKLQIEVGKHATLSKIFFSCEQMIEDANKTPAGATLLGQSFFQPCESLVFGDFQKVQNVLVASKESLAGLRNIEFVRQNNANYSEFSALPNLLPPECSVTIISITHESATSRTSAKTFSPLNLRKKIEASRPEIEPAPPLENPSVVIQPSANSAAPQNLATQHRLPNGNACDHCVVQ